MANDYRNSTYCSALENLETKKKSLSGEISRNHPRTKIIYNKIKNQDSIYKAKFMEAYNYKCSYCGNSIDNISSTLFEVDHYICESSFDSREEAGRIENLVLACYDCNRSKSGFLIEERLMDTLNPDLDNVKNVFSRDDLYYIRVSEQYKSDEFINKFYEQLKLGYQSRRLDYLLLSLNGLCKKLDREPQSEKLNVILRKLQQKRNLTSSKKVEYDLV